MKKRFRGAIIGYGFIAGYGHGPAYLKRQTSKEDVEIVAVADICQARMQAAKENFPEARVYHDYKDLLFKEKDLDFVDICTPPSDHGRIASLALERGHHVLCEKPLTTTAEEAHQLFNQAQNAKRVLFPCHNYRHAPVIKAIDQIIKSGEIGTVHGVTIQTFRNTHAKGVPEWEKNWRRFKKWSGGGIAMDHGSHSFYLAFDWLRSYPTSVTAKAINLGAKEFETEDNFQCALNFPTGLCSVYLSWTSGVRKVIYTLHGDQGAIIAEDDDITVSVMRRTSGPDMAQGAVEWTQRKVNAASNWGDASHWTWFNSLFDEFLEAIEQRNFTSRQLREAVLCVEVIGQAYKSSIENCRELSLAPSEGLI